MDDFESIDPHKRIERFEKWKNTPITDISKQNQNILKDYISDLERGLNVGGSKGTRGAGRLLSNISQLKRVMKSVQETYKIKDITKINEKQLHEIFLKIQRGEIKKDSGKPYLSTSDVIKRFKTFWHWWMKTNKKKGIEIIDITSDLKGESSKKAKFVYFTNEQLEQMLKIADYDTKTYMLFLFDTGIRSPKEAMNTRVSDFSHDFRQLNIRDEISKTFGRKIRLMMCSEVIEKYIKNNNLKDNDLLFTFSPETINKKLKSIGKKVIGDKITLGSKKGSELTMYDFRHSSVCYWLPRYKSRNALLYRFGWSRENEIHYYSNLLGMTDTISEEDMLLNATRTEIEKQMAELKVSNESKTKRIEELERKINYVIKSLPELQKLNREISKQSEQSISLLRSWGHKKR